jgi:hypothetical protein
LQLQQVEQLIAVSELLRVSGLQLISMLQFKHLSEQSFAPIKLKLACFSVVQFHFGLPLLIFENLENLKTISQS